MAQTFSPYRIRQGAKETGMLPISRRPLLNHPNIPDGDVMFAATRSKMAKNVLMGFQNSTGSTSSEGSAQLSSTPERKESAESTYTSISQQKPRLGPRRLFANSTPEKAIFEKEVKRVQAAVNDSILRFDINLPQYREAKKESVLRQKEQLQKLIQQLDESVITTENKLKQERAHLELFQVKLQEEDLTPNGLAMIDEKLEDLSVAERDSFGLPISQTANVESPFVEDIEGFDTQVLQDAVTKAYESVLARASVGTKRKRNRDGNVPFKIGVLMQHTGEIEGTSDALYTMARDHENRKAQAELEAKENENVKRQKHQEQVDALPEKLDEAKAKIKVNSDGGLLQASVGDCRDYLKLLMRQERFANGATTELSNTLRGIGKLKGRALVDKVVSLAYPKQ
jgi:hypothetical protein